MTKTARRRHAGTDRRIAQAMCDAATQILWPHTRNWVRHRRPRALFEARPGRGLGTYCQIGPYDRFLLNFGAGMVRSKLQGTECVNWTTGIEISERGYFGGRLTPVNLFAATCLHEYAHLIDHVRSGGGRRVNGRHHGTAFYEILDRMHANPVAGQVRGFLDNRFRHEALPTRFDDGRAIVTETLAELRKRYRRGQLAKFHDGRGVEIIGRIVRINRLSITLAVGSGRDAVSYRVPASHLQPT